MEFTDFRVVASDLASLIGVFGSKSQYNSLMKVWKKSSFKTSFVKDQSALNQWQSDQNHIVTMNVFATWQKLNDDISSCSSQESWTFLMKRATDILFQNPYISEIYLHLFTFLKEEDRLMLDKTRYFEYFNQSYDILEEFKNKYHEHSSKFQILLQSCRLNYTFKKRISCIYGCNAEKIFLGKFNQLHSSKILSHGEEFSKRMPDIDNISWSIDGKIDGIYESKLIEIKHRLDKLSPNVPLYEQIQICAYLFLTERKQGTIIQCVLQSNQSLYAESLNVDFSIDFWDKIVQHLSKCLRFIYCLHSQNLSRDCFLALDEISRFQIVERYVGSFH